MLALDRLQRRPQEGGWKREGEGGEGKGTCRTEEEDSRRPSRLVSHPFVLIIDAQQYISYSTFKKKYEM